MGYRVRVNLKTRYTSKPYRLGSAAFIPRDGELWVVHWDGLKAPQSYAKQFIEIVGEGGDSELFLSEGWRSPEDFVRDVYEAITVNCNDPNTREKTIRLMRERFKEA